MDYYLDEFRSHCDDDDDDNNRVDGVRLRF
jgi:hypothetical protein